MHVIGMHENYLPYRGMNEYMRLFFNMPLR